MKPILAILAFVCCFKLMASPLLDLSSPLQEKRDAAAKVLRSSYAPPPRTNWDELISKIKMGDSMTNVLKLIRQYNPKSESEMGVGSGQTSFEIYRLDDYWMLRCDFEYGSNDFFDRKLFGKEIIEHMRYVWVAPPSNFTGIWITYFVNGQKNRETKYNNGNKGEFIVYRPDGSKSYVHSADGETGYFPSGRISYAGKYKEGKQIGKWFWYNEDGSTNSVKDYSKP